MGSDNRNIGVSKNNVKRIVYRKNSQLNINNKFRINVRKSIKFGLVKIHDKEFIGWREFRSFLRKLGIEVAYVPLIFL